MVLAELYQEDRTLVPRPRAIWHGYVLSGWWRRVGATLLDCLIVVPGALLIGFGLGLEWDEVESASWSDQVWLSLLGGVLASLLYYPLIMRATDGRTLGKMAARIRVVRTDGKPMSLTRAAWREVVLKTVAISVLPGRSCLNFVPLGPTVGPQETKFVPASSPTKKGGGAIFSAAATAPFMLPQLVEPGT